MTSPTRPLSRSSFSDANSTADDALTCVHSSGFSTPTTLDGSLTPSRSTRIPDPLKTVVPRHGEVLLPSDRATKTASLITLPHKYERGAPRDEENGPRTPSDVPEKFLYRIPAGDFGFFICGWGDGVTATVLPFFIKEFNITFMTSSLLYAASAIGFIGGTFLLEFILNQLGRTRSSGPKPSWFPYIPFLSKSNDNTTPVRYSPAQGRHLSLIISAIILSLYYVLMGTRAGYPAVFMGYVIAGIARAILTGLLNPYFSSVAPMYVGYGHALWSFGTVLAPLICQTIIAEGVAWPYFYFGSLILAVLNIVFLSIAFIPTPKELEDERRSSCSEDVSSCSTPSTIKTEADIKYPASIPAKQPSILRQVLSHPFQWVIAILAGFYYATETTSQGFIVSYILERRNGDLKTAGYVPSGFFAGIMVGRISWGAISQIASFKQRRYIVLGGLIVALAMHLIVWFVNSVPANAVAMVVMGLFLGPVFPAIINMVAVILPPEQRLLSMAVTSAGSSFGCAALPFAAGVLLNAKGVYTLPYWNVASTASLAILWSCLPSAPPQLGVSRWLSRK